MLAVAVRQLLAQKTKIHTTITVPLTIWFVFVGSTLRLATTSRVSSNFAFALFLTHVTACNGE